MKTLWLVILVGLASGFFTEKSMVLAQLPAAADDLYLEGRTSGDLPIDDEDGDDDGSGSGSGDHVYMTDEAELLKILNFTKTTFGRVEPIQPQPKADSPHYGPTTAAERQEPATAERDPAPKPTSSDKEMVDFRPTADWATLATSPVPPIYTTAIDEDYIDGDYIEVDQIDAHIPEKGVQNEVLAKDGRGSKIYELDSPREVTSENLWQRTEVLAAVIACGVVGFLCAVFLLLFLVYRMKKKDEGSYDLGETKLANTAYHKAPTQEFYA